ncbi:glycosyltransferase [Aeoliella mucimassa]|uniref:glycosyltransferase n=1 Tax=Aeoliella mucimassa TaxID=2527972 RepID=UPI0018D294E4|nr:glycosyltransferase [Aeoliella mucimassa]
MIDRLSRAGTESQLLLTIKQLDRSKFEPYLCLLDGNDDESQALLPDNCPTWCLGIRRLVSPRAIQQGWKFWNLLRQHRIGVVQTFFPDSTRFAAPLAKAAGVRQVVGSRRNIGHWMTARDKRIARFYNQWFIDKIVANCEAARQAVIEQENAKPDQVVVVHNAIDLERFKDIAPWTPKPAGVPRKVGMVGNLRPVKGPDLFIHAAALVLHEIPDTTFEIAGGGDQAPYQRIIDSLGISDQVKLLGSVDDIPSFLATLDVAVLPSRAEGCSNALLEYMAAGRPIVATDVGGNSIALGHLAPQTCITSENVNGIATRILDYLCRSDVAREIAEGSADLVLASQSCVPLADLYSLRH